MLESDFVCVVVDALMPTKPESFYEREIDRVYREGPFRPEQYAQVRQSRAFMDSCYADKIELNELAAAAFMSRFHYVRIFQQIYGLTPRVYLRDLRIAKAKALLIEGLPITQVCFDVGYESLPTFSAAFKKCTGYTPRAYRRIHKSNPE